jgi:hypothetical protein
LQYNNCLLSDIAINILSDSKITNTITILLFAPLGMSMR